MADEVDAIEAERDVQGTLFGIGPATMTATNQDLISRVLNLYYVDELTQAEVGRRLGLSTAKVNRLLQQARQQGMVEITIHTPLQHVLELEYRLKAIFDIRR